MGVWRKQLQLLPTMFGDEGEERLVIGTGPHRVCVTVAVHGNEPAGVLAVRELMDEGLLPAGVGDGVTLTVLLGNPAAFRDDKRFVDANLNRAFTEATLAKDAAACCYEERRAGELWALGMGECDAYLDLHSTSTDSPAMALPAEAECSVALAQVLPVGYVVRKLAHMTASGGTTLDLMLARRPSVPAVCIECGGHRQASSVLVARQAILAMAQGATVVRGADCPPPTVLSAVGIRRCGPAFAWLRSVSAFQTVPAGTPLYRDDEVGEFVTENECILVMPTSLPVEGEEAYFETVRDQ